MERMVEPVSGMQIIFTDEPERAKVLADSGSCFITLLGEIKGAAAYVEKTEDFDELSDEFLIRTWCHYMGKNYQLMNEAGICLRECDRRDYQYVCELLKSNREAVTGFEDNLWMDDITAELQFEKTVKEYYELFDFGLWILEMEGERAGIFGLSAEDYGTELYYILDKCWRGRGIAADICGRICVYAQTELGIEKLYIRTSEKNQPSRQLAERLGFKLYSSEGDGAITELKFIKEL